MGQKRRKRRPVVAKKLRIGRSPTSRFGVFAKEDIKKEEYILKSGSLRGYFQKYFYYLNHSCKPNTWLKRGRDECSDLLFALRDIKLGEEIAMDYRDTRWGEEYYYNRILKKGGGCRCPSCAKKKII